MRMDIQKTFQFGDATITVRREKIKHRLAIEALEARLVKEGDSEEVQRNKRIFVRLTQQSEVQGDLGFPIPLPTATAEELDADYNLFTECDADLYDTWVSDMVDVNKSLKDAPKADAAGTDPKDAKSPAKS
jgi:hypothetical protein